MHGAGPYSQPKAWRALAATIRRRVGGAIAAANAVTLTAQTNIAPSGPYGVALGKATQELRLAAKATREAYGATPQDKRWSTFNADLAALNAWDTVLGQSPKLTAWEGIKRAAQGMDGIRALKRNRQNQLNAALGVIIDAAMRGRIGVTPNAPAPTTSSAQNLSRAKKSAAYSGAGPIITAPGGFLATLPPWLRTAALLGGALLVVSIIRK